MDWAQYTKVGDQPSPFVAFNFPDSNQICICVDTREIFSHCALGFKQAIYCHSQTDAFWSGMFLQ